MVNDLLNALPQFSPWPMRLLGLEPWEPKKKVSAEIKREYEDEKWGPLWKRVSASAGRITIAEVERWLLNSDTEIPCWNNGHLQMMSPKDAYRKQFDIIATALQALPSGDVLVEMGAGYGQIILNLALQKEFAATRIIAAEYTESGQRLINYLAESQHLSITTAHCDFSASPITELTLPANSVIFTSYAACYVPKYEIAFIKELISWKPALVVHFEPIYEHCDEKTLLGLMQNKYILANDYNRNLMTVINEEAAKGKLEVLLENKQVFGMNPFLPFSIIAWKPLDHTTINNR